MSSEPTDILVEHVYNELRRLADRFLSGERGTRSFGATDLVHEAYLRLAKPGSEAQWDRKAHFFGAAAKAMRRVLVEKARSRKRVKRGGGVRPVPLDGALASVWTVDRLDEALALDDALTRLEGLNERAAKVVELRYFAGLTIDQTAEALGVSSSLVSEDWAAARAWLRSEMSGA